MNYALNFLLLLILCVFTGCGGKTKYMAPREDDEILNNFTLFKQEMPPLLSATPNSSNQVISAPLIIHNPLSSALTVWALAPGNWIWGYTLLHSKSFGEARIWQVKELGDNVVIIINKKTSTCISEHGSGITHEKCNENSKFQKWKLLPMDNGAVQLMSMSSNKCVTTESGSIIDTQRYYSITMNVCNKAQNYNQQWRFLPPTYYATPLYN